MKFVTTNFIVGRGFFPFEKFWKSFHNAPGDSCSYLPGAGRHGLTVPYHERLYVFYQTGTLSEREGML